VKLLLDTHALIWWLSDDTRLAGRARGLIADPANDVLVSVVALWEIVVKQRVGKLRLDISQVVEAVERGGLGLLDISAAHLLTLATLPAHHRDPFDHLLIAQAISEAATFVSDDRRVATYAVRSITCSGLAARRR
jgi:PIN domain nuclease of toxin-antitoxin system